MLNLMGESLKEVRTLKEGRSQQQRKIIFAEGGSGFCCKWTISSVWSLYSQVPNTLGGGQNTLGGVEKVPKLNIWRFNINRGVRILEMALNDYIAMKRIKITLSESIIVLTKKVDEMDDA